MSRVLTNNTSLSFAIEASVGVLPGSPTWFALEPNSIGAYGATLTTVPRSPISANRQRRKGAVTDLDSTVDWEADLTLSHFTQFAEAFVFAVATNQDLSFLGGNVTGTGYTVAALSAGQVAKLHYTAGGPISLLHANGYAVAANGGLKALNSQPIATNTELTVTGVSAETAAANATVDIAGIRPEIGDLAISVTAGIVTLTSGNNGAINSIDFTTLGLTVGQFIHIGGLLAANQFATGIAGYARVTSVAAGTVILDMPDAALVTATGAGDTVDLLFGRFIRNVPTNHADFLERSVTFELAFPNLDNPSGDRFEYAKGNYSNTMSVNLPLTEKATLGFSFIGTDSAPPTTTRETNAATPLNPTRTGAFSTSIDCARLRINEVDNSGTYTDFKSLTLTFNNGVTPEKLLCTLGASFMNFGNFEVDLEAQMLFSDFRVVEAIRDNRTMSMSFGVKNDDGAMMIDIPSMTLGGGGREFPVNESVLVNTTIQAFQDPVLNTSVGISLFPVAP